METRPPKKIILDNGIKVILDEIKDRFSSAVSVWIDAGVVDENQTNNGVSHFIEHIVFKGTKTRSSLDIAEQSEDVGANLNAFTEREHTCFHTNVLSDYAPVVIELFLDMLFHPKLDEKEFELERQVILEEIKMYKDTPEDLAQDLMFEKIWKGHPVGRPITGTIETITNLKKIQVTSCLNTLYTPDNMVISLAGNFNEKEIMKKIEELTQDVNKKKNKSAAPPLTVNSEIFFEDKQIEQAHLCFATNGVSVYDEDRYTLAVMDIALGGGSSSRLFQEIREKRGLAYSISSSYHTNRLGGIFGIYAGTTFKDMPVVVDLILKEIKKVKEHGLKQEELKRAKMQLRTNLLVELESTTVRAFRNALYELYYNHFLSPEIISQSIQSITNERILNMANKIFDQRYFTLVVVGPEKKLSKDLSF